MLEIIDFEEKYSAEFKKLNLEWLDKYNLTEEADLKVLNDPTGTIINTGGYIFLAVENNEVVGTAGLMKEHEGVYELVKMSVNENYQGRGISKILLQKCLEKAKAIQAHSLILFSNHQLERALSLYEKFGFRHVPVENSPFETADVKMELIFS